MTTPAELQNTVKELTVHLIDVHGFSEKHIVEMTLTHLGEMRRGADFVRPTNVWRTSMEFLQNLCAEDATKTGVH